MGLVAGKPAKDPRLLEDTERDSTCGKADLKIVQDSTMASSMNKRDFVKGAIYGALIMDAAAAPTHWFYGGAMQVRDVYGGLLTHYTKPVDHLPGSIMSKSDTGGGGRGGYHGDIIGSVIFHGKKKYWAPGADHHYHNLLKAGENTLEGSLMMRTVDVLTDSNGKFDREALTKDYIDFMTTPDSHNDTYCGTCHRMFFAKWAKGNPPDKCPDNDGHNVDTCDALVTTIPVALSPADDSDASRLASEMVSITRDSKVSSQMAQLYATALRDVTKGIPARDAAVSIGKSLGIDVAHAATRSRADPMTACYISQSLPSVLVMVYKYGMTNDKDVNMKKDAGSTSPSKAFERAVWANANRGGENVGTGALIGALLGAECGFSRLPRQLVSDLEAHVNHNLEARVDAFLNKVEFTKL